MEREIYANAVLKNGKLIFWWTGCKCKDIYDFNKDFYYSGMNMMKEIKNHKYEIKSERIDNFEQGREFYSQFELCEEYKGQKPY